MEITELFLFSIFIVQAFTVSGQHMLQEQIMAKSSCDLKNTFLFCESNHVIGIHSVGFHYHPECDSVCCTYNANHSTANQDDEDIGVVRRTCSGQRNCTLDLTGVRSFGPHGIKEPSYASLQYYCISQSRIGSLCSNVELTSHGLPLYLTNANYPSVTTGDSTCSCSIEVDSCSSEISLFILDVNLYLDIQYCEQSLEFSNATDHVIENVGCGNYDSADILVIDIKSNYVKIHFLDNSTQDQEGYIFLGFQASKSHVNFSLSCSSKPSSICHDCGDPGDITEGTQRLHEANNSSYGAIADVRCNTGHEADKDVVTCLKNGKWGNVTCSLKDCGNLPKIENGVIELDDNQNTKYGAEGKVTCTEEFESSKNKIFCLASGSWSRASCITEADDNNILVIVLASVLTPFAVVIILVMVIYFMKTCRKKH